MNRISPKALPVFNLTEAILEETRMPKVIEFNQERAEQKDRTEKPWKIRFLIFGGLLCWFWYEAAKQLGWLN
jgi:hypothetical protein